MLLECLTSSKYAGTVISNPLARFWYIPILWLYLGLLVKEKVLKKKGRKEEKAEWISSDNYHLSHRTRGHVWNISVDGKIGRMFSGLTERGTISNGGCFESLS